VEASRLLCVFEDLEANEALGAIARTFRRRSGRI
jgi:hypothetical protein